MDAATTDILRNRVKPLLNEVFDGFVIIGYHTDADGKRMRFMTFDDGRKPDGSVKDVAVADGLSAMIQVGRNWGVQGS